MLQRLATLISLYKFIDFVVDHRDQIQQWAPGVGFAMTGIFGAWAYLSEQPPVVLVTIAFTIFAAILTTLTEIPRWLEKYKPRPFAITIRFNQLSMFSTVVPISILNRSKQDRLILTLTLCIPLSNGQECQIPYEHTLDQITYENTLAVEPQEHVSRELSFIPKAPPVGPIFLYHEAYLLVYDNISRRSGKVKIPGSYPPQ